MAEIGLHRADPQRLATLAKDGVERPNLNRIAQGGAGAVGLNIADLLWFDPRFLQCLANYRLLGGAARGREAAAAPILVDHRTANQCQNRIAIGLGIGKAFQHHHAAAFATAKTVGRGVKGFAASIQCVHPIRRAVTVRQPKVIHQQVDATSQG